MMRHARSAARRLDSLRNHPASARSPAENDESLDAARYRLLARATNDPIYDLDLVTNRIDWNDATWTVFRYRREDVGAPDIPWWTANIHPDDRERVIRSLDRALVRGDDAWSDEYRYRRGDGTYATVLDRGYVVRDASGAPVRLVGTMVDLTERKRVEEALRFLVEASTALASSLDVETLLATVLRLAVPSLADWCSLDLSHDGRVHRLTAAHARPEKVELVREHARRLRDDAPHEIPRALRTGRSELLTDCAEAVRAVTSDPEHAKTLRALAPISMITVPLLVGGRTAGAMTLASAESGRRYDQVDLSLAEDLARRASAALDNARLFALSEQERERAERASRLKDEFLATVSHELRTPLTAVLGWARLLESREFDRATTRKAISTIVRNAKVQAQLIEDLLDVSRIIAGKLRLDTSPIDPAAVIAAALDTARPAAEAKGVTMTTEIAPDLGILVGDEDRLQQVIWNLLSNAVKFTPRGGRVKVRAARDEEAVVIAVSDTGTGIAPDFLPYVFERFRQGDATSTRKHGGLGLGLAVVKQLIELHGGTVRAESEGEGRGATITVRLPVRALVPSAAAPAAASSPPLRAPAARPGALASARVLVVDDEADARDLLSMIFEQYGATVKAAASAREAMAALGGFAPDVLVSDIGMPEEDGYALIRQLRAQGVSRLPAVALTAYARPEDERLALAAGFQAHLSKPIDPAALAAIVARLLAP